MLVTIGIATDGRPRVTTGRTPDQTSGHATGHTPDLTSELRPGLTRVHNVAIGLGFHWQRTIECDFPGELRPNPDPDSPYTLLNTLPLETYLECVVGSEMNPSAPPEFLRAHAIISRSWAAGKILRQHPAETPAATSVASGSHRVIIGWEDTSDHHGFHLCADDHCQRYQGVQPLSPEAREAIRSTAGIVLTGPSGKIVDARFSKCCGGTTELFSTCWQDERRDTPAPECLESFDDPWCDLSGLTPEERDSLLRTILKDYDRSTGGGYRWQTDVSAGELRDRLRERHGIDIGEITAIEPLRRGRSGRISLLRLHGTTATLDLGKELYIRRLLSPDCLYSSAFEATPIGDSTTDASIGNHLTFRLRGKGWGHGVGLCQTGAAHMAVCGRSHTSILRFYYPNSSLTHLDTLIASPLASPISE